MCPRRSCTAERVGAPTSRWTLPPRRRPQRWRRQARARHLARLRPHQQARHSRPRGRLQATVGSTRGRPPDDEKFDWQAPASAPLVVAHGLHAHAGAFGHLANGEIAHAQILSASSVLVAMRSRSSRHSSAPSGTAAWTLGACWRAGSSVSPRSFTADHGGQFGAITSTRLAQDVGDVPLYSFAREEDSRSNSGFQAPFVTRRSTSRSRAHRTGNRTSMPVANSRQQTRNSSEWIGPLPRWPTRLQLRSAPGRRPISRKRCASFVHHEAPQRW